MLTRETILGLSIVAGIAAAACASANHFGAAKVNQSNRVSRNFFTHGLWALATLKLAMMLHATMSGYVTEWQDDACRFMMTTNFMSDFRLGPPDHIWPGGPFMLGAAVMHLADDPVSAVRWLAMMFSVVSVLSMGWLVRDISGSAAGGLAAALLVSMLPMHTWLGNGAMTEVPMACLITLSLMFAAIGWRRERERLKWGRVAIAASGFCATATASYRYEGWMFLVALGGVAWLHWLWLAWRRDGIARWHGVSLIVAMLIAVSFPAAWAIDSWRVNGSPTAFFKSQVGMNTVGVTEPLRARLMLFPIGMNNQIKALWGLVFGGLICAAIRWRVKPRQTFFALVAIGYFAVMVGTVALKGMGVSLERYVISLIVLAIPFCGVAVAECAELARRYRGVAALPALIPAAACILTLGLFTVSSAREIQNYKWFGFRNETFVAGSLLQQEFHEPQLLPAIGRGGRVMIQQFDHVEGLAHHWHIALMAGNYPNRILFTEEEALGETVLREKNLTLIRFNAADRAIPDGFVEVMRGGTMQVLTKAETSP